MKVQRPAFSTLALCLFLLWFGTYAYQYAFNFYQFKPLFSYLILFAYVCVCLPTIANRSALNDRGSQHVLIWAFIFAAYCCMAYLVSSQSPEAWQICISWLESSLILAGFILLFRLCRDLKAIQWTYAGIAIVAVALNFYDFFEPTFSNVLGRAAGLYQNPNIAGKMISLSMIASFPVIPRQGRLLFVIACGSGILVTFSRNSWLLWVVGIFSLGWTTHLFPSRYRIAGILASGLLGIGVLSLLLFGAIGRVADDGPMGNYLDSNTRIRLGIGGEQFSDAAADERVQLALTAFEMGAQSPLLGQGFAYTRENSGWPAKTGPHNMYLLFWAEGGIIGLTIYLWLLVILWRYSQDIGHVLTIQIAVVGLFTHNQLDQPASLIFPAFIVAHGALHRRHLPGCKPRTPDPGTQ